MKNFSEKTTVSKMNPNGKGAERGLFGAS